MKYISGTQRTGPDIRVASRPSKPVNRGLATDLRSRATISGLAAAATGPSTMRCTTPAFSWEPREDRHC